MGPGGSVDATAADVFMTPQSETQARYRVAVCLQTGTVVFALHKALPLSEPLHADAQDDRGRLLRLELFVQLRARQQANAVSHSTQRTEAALPGPDYLDESVYFHLPAFSQSLDLHLADGTHVEMVDRRAASESTSTGRKITKRAVES